jgi:hypothetical protein
MGEARRTVPPSPPLRRGRAADRDENTICRAPGPAHGDMPDARQKITLGEMRAAVVSTVPNPLINLDGVPLLPCEQMSGLSPNAGLTARVGLYRRMGHAQR